MVNWPDMRRVCVSIQEWGRPLSHAHTSTRTHTVCLHYITIGFVSGFRLNNKEYKNTWTSFHFAFHTVLFYIFHFSFSVFVIRQQQQRAVASGMWQRQDLNWITLSSIYTLYIIYYTHQSIGTQRSVWQMRRTENRKSNRRRNKLLVFFIDIYIYIYVYVCMVNLDGARECVLDLCNRQQVELAERWQGQWQRGGASWRTV